MVETDILSCRNRFMIFNPFFLSVDTVTEMSETQVLGKTYSAARKGFPVQWKMFSFIPCFFSASEDRY